MSNLETLPNDVLEGMLICLDATYVGAPETERWPTFLATMQVLGELNRRLEAALTDQ